jgi:hypothetical protein
MLSEGSGLSLSTSQPAGQAGSLLRAVIHRCFVQTRVYLVEVHLQGLTLCHTRLFPFPSPAIERIVQLFAPAIFADVVLENSFYESHSREVSPQHHYACHTSQIQPVEASERHVTLV